MKSYAEHLTSTQSFGEAVDVLKKPVTRASAVFPCIVNSAVDTQILFLGYWLLKRQLKEVSLLVTVRNAGGETLARRFDVIEEVRAYRMSLRDILADAADDFAGSIELEVFSTRDMVFPYPAFVVTYVSDEGATFVHTTGRIYNDIEDQIANTVNTVPETGFDLLPEEGFRPFISFVNGPVALEDQVLKVDILTDGGEVLSKDLPLGRVAPYETRHVSLLEEAEKAVLGGRKGSARIRHEFAGFFPRFVAGNHNADWSRTSVTHTYYDTADQATEAAYWTNPAPDVMYDSVLSFPLYAREGEYTELAIYPIFSPSDIAVDLAIFGWDGSLLAEEEGFGRIEGAAQRLQYLDVGAWAKDRGLRLDPQGSHAVRMILRGGGRLPARLKFGLNIGRPAGRDIPSNVCFGARVSNVKLLEKPGTFKWAPLLNCGGAEFSVMNISPARGGFRAATLEMSFWREVDGESLTRKVVLADNGSLRFRLADDAEVAAFLGGASGWVTIRSDNPFVEGYALEDLGHGIVGADHFF